MTANGARHHTHGGGSGKQGPVSMLLQAVVGVMGGGDAVLWTVGGREQGRTQDFLKGGGIIFSCIAASRVKKIHLT